MPATVRYKAPYPTETKPIESSASVGSDGLVTAEALFLTNKGFEINTPISPSYFSALNTVHVQGMFVESRSIEKRGGLWFLRIRAVGATNPNVFETSVDVSPRSFNKSETFKVIVNEEEVDQTLSFSFDYISESITTKTVYLKNQKIVFPDLEPRVLEIYNKKGLGVITQQQVIGQNALQSRTPRVIAFPRILTTETRSERAGIVQFQKTFQFVYE